MFLDEDHDPDFVFFTGGYFSNWYPADVSVKAFPFSANETVFNCTEQAMMYIKAVVHDDLEIAQLIMQSNDPAQQKHLGRSVRNFKPKWWRDNCEELFYPALLAKFKQHDGARAYMLSTGDKTIVEAAPWDKIWGIGIGVGHPDIRNPAKWQGDNLLGKMLMNVRADIRNNG